MASYTAYDAITGGVDGTLTPTKITSDSSVAAGVPTVGFGAFNILYKVITGSSGTNTMVKAVKPAVELKALPGVLNAAANALPVIDSTTPITNIIRPMGIVNKSLNVVNPVVAVDNTQEYSAQVKDAKQLSHTMFASMKIEF